MNIDLEAQITQLLELKNEETGQITFLIEINGEWQKITKEEYDKLLGDSDD